MRDFYQRENVGSEFLHIEFVFIGGHEIESLFGSGGILGACGRYEV
jgi:hypothetical protein